MAAGTFTVRGVKVRTASQRRFVLFRIAADGRFDIVKRSDNAGNLRAIKARHAFDRSVWTVVIVDTVTGSEVT